MRPASAAVSQGFGGGGRSSSSFSCTCICITNYFYSLTDKGSFSLCDLTTTSAACMDGSRAPAAEAGTQKCQCAQEQQGPTLSTASPSSMPPSTSLHASLVRSGSTCVPNRHQARGACDVGRGLGLKQSVKRPAYTTTEVSQAGPHLVVCIAQLHASQHELRQLPRQQELRRARRADLACGYRQTVVSQSISVHHKEAPRGPMQASAAMTPCPARVSLAATNLLGQPSRL